jgi:hypothetical protein
MEPRNNWQATTPVSPERPGAVIGPRLGGATHYTGDWMVMNQDLTEVATLQSCATWR